MIPPKEMLEEIVNIAKNQRAKENLGEVELQELDNLVKLISSDKTTKNDYKTSFPITGFTAQQKSLRKDKDEYERNYDFAIEVLNQLLIPYRKSNSKTAQNIPNAVAIPAEIRWAISYMVYRAVEIAENIGYSLDDAIRMVNQAQILRSLSLGHNTFSKWGIRPKQYYHVTHYEQPNSPIHYMGAKTGDYGYAVRQLVYQAGLYDVFADIFGGGGNASMAVTPIDNKKYIYNELDPMVLNVVEVLKDDDLCRKLVGALEELQDEAQGGEASVYLDGYLSPDTARDFFNRRYAKMIANKKTALQTNKQRKKVKDVNSLPVYLNYEEMKKFILEYNKELKNQYNPNDVIEIEGKSYKMPDLLCEDDDGRPDVFRYYEYNVQTLAGRLGVESGGYHFALLDDMAEIPEDIPESIIRKYDRLFERNHRETLRELGKGEYNKHYKGLGEPFSIASFTPGQKKLYDEEMKELRELRVGGKSIRDDFIQYWLLCYWCLFREKFDAQVNSGAVPESADDKVFYALAYIFLRFFAFKGTKDETSTYILYAQKNQPKIEKFLGTSLSDEIEAFHKRFSRVELSNMDFRDFIIDIAEGYGNAPDSIVLYSDSPYLETQKYSEDFAVQDMKSLVWLLMNIRQKFIFSCRACRNMSDIKGKGEESLKKANKSLLDNLFRIFERESARTGIKLNVLAIEEGGRDLANHLRASDIVEIMICNFEIRSFSNTGKSSKTEFKVYDFNTFMQIFLNNAIL